MHLKVGQKVPEFIFTSMDGKTYTHASMLGKKYMISFYRYASCPFCNLRISFLIETHKNLKLKNQFLAVFQSDPSDMEKHVMKQEAEFPIISDSRMIYYKKFGVEKSIIGYLKSIFHLKDLLMAFKRNFKLHQSQGPITTIPADFIISEEGVVLDLYYGKAISDHMPLEIVEKYFE